MPKPKHTIERTFILFVGCFYRAKLRAIQVLAILKTQHIRTYQCDSLLQEFVAQANQLASVSFIF